MQGPAVGVLPEEAAVVGREHANGEETEEKEVVERRVPADDEETARPSGEEVWRKVATADVDVLSDEKEVVEGRVPADVEETAWPLREEVWRKVATADVDVLTDEKEVVEDRVPADDNEVSCACFLTQIRARHLKKIVLTEN